MREIIKEGKTVDIQTRDRLLFTAVIDIYEHLTPMVTFYKVGMWLVTALGGAFILLVFGLMTGQVELLFK